MDLESKLNPYKSEGERRVARTLDQYGVFYIYEQPVKLRVDGKVRTFRPDFYLPKLDVYIEYFGRAGNRDYDKRTRYKKATYAANKMKVISVYPWNLVQNWPGYLIQRLQSSTPASIPKQHYRNTRSYRPRRQRYRK